VLYVIEDKWFCGGENLVKCAKCGREIPKGKEKKVVSGKSQVYCPRCIDELTGTERR